MVVINQIKVWRTSAVVGQRGVARPATEMIETIPIAVRIVLPVGDWTAFGLLYFC